jgi:hypothetical protein
VIQIRKNLEAALRHLRLTQEARYLWVDAICINQDDMDERSRQVSIMSEIYSKASQVVVWLGEREEPSDRVPHAVSHWKSSYATRKGFSGAFAANSIMAEYPKGILDGLLNRS